MKLKYYSLLLLAPIALMANASETSGVTDIIPRTINFLIFAAILYYYVADAAKKWYFERKNEIAGKLDSIQVKLKESHNKKEVALQKVEEAKATARTLVETAKKEAVLLSEKVIQDAEVEIENLEKAFQDRTTIERRKMQRMIVSEILDDLFKEGSISLDNDEIVNIVNKKVA